MITRNASFLTRIGGVEHKLDEGYKKDNGVFYTDPIMVWLILQQLPISRDDIIVDPCCGTGSFLLVAKKLGCANVFGADKDSYALEQCKESAGIHNVVCMDTLGNAADAILSSLSLEDKVDFVVGNPPYAPIAENVTLNTDDLGFRNQVRLFGNNLFVAALVRAFQLAKEEGIISYIIPKNFLHVSSYSKFRKEILEHKTIISIVDIGAYFKEVRGEQIVITLKNRAPQRDHRIIFKKFDGKEFIPTTKVLQEFYTDEVVIFYSDEDHTIYQRLSTMYRNLGNFCAGNIRRGRSRSDTAISGKDLRKFGYKNKALPQKGKKVFLQNIYSTEAGIIGAFGGDYEASETITVITSGNENMCHYILGLIHSRLCNFFLYKYCYNNSKLTMHTDAKYLAKIPFVAANDSDISRVVKVVKDLEDAEYLSIRWFQLVETLNILIYSIYGLNKQEITYVDSETKRIQSRRWMKETVWKNDE